MSAPLSRVIVAGGGISGLTLATALRQRDVEVVLVEIRADKSATGKRKWLNVGHGITLQGNALRAFATIGVLDQILANGYAFDKLNLHHGNGDLIAEMATPPLGGPGVPPTAGALRSDLSRILVSAAREHGVDIRLGTTVESFVDDGDRVDVTLSDRTVETADLLVAADGIRSATRKLIGIEIEPQPVGMGIWRVVAARPPEMTSSGVYNGGPKYRAGYTPISEDLCYAFLLEENLDRAYIGERSNGATFKAHGAGYGGTWGKVRDSVPDDAAVNYQWIESVDVEQPWFRGRAIAIGDAVHACPPTIAQGAAMCAEDAVVLAEMLTAGDEVATTLPAFLERRTPRVAMVLANSLAIARHDMDPEDGTDSGRVMGETLHALCASA